MFGSDVVHIKDHRGFESVFWWSDVLTALGVYPGDGEEDWVKVKFRSDRQSDLHIEMSMVEFLAEIMKQLGPTSTPSYVTPSQVTITPLSNPYQDGPADHVETWMKND